MKVTASIPEELVNTDWYKVDIKDKNGGSVSGYAYRKYIKGTSTTSTKNTSSSSSVVSKQTTSNKSNTVSPLLSSNKLPTYININDVKNDIETMSQQGGKYDPNFSSNNTDMSWLTTGKAYMDTKNTAFLNVGKSYMEQKEAREKEQLLDQPLLATRGLGDIYPYSDDIMISDYEIPDIDYSKFISDGFDYNMNNNRNVIIYADKSKTTRVDQDAKLRAILKNTYNVRAERVESLLEKILDKMSDGNDTSGFTQSNNTGTNPTELFDDDSIPSNLVRLYTGE